MRIRKRFLSLSAAITTPPSSDLPSGNHHHHQPPLSLVQHQQLHPNSNQHVNQSHHRLPPSSSDHTTQIGLQPTTCNPSGDTNNTKIFKEMKYERSKDVIKIDDTETRTNESLLCAQAKNHDLVLEGWVHGDMLVPMKKKRGSNGKRLNDDGVVEDSKMTIEGSTMKLKGKKNEGVIMEGSRCSRVNGRGWRCSQQTLVGYSLCEHHLGKGRLRSMTSVRVARKEQQAKERKDKQPQLPLVNDHDDIEDDDGDEGDEDFKDWDGETMSSIEGTKIFGKKKKVGMVKARSLSSLLSQISS